MAGFARPGSKGVTRKNHEAVLLLLVRVGLLLGWSDGSWDSVSNKAVGDRYLAEAREDLLSEFFSRRCFLCVTPFLLVHKLGFSQEKEPQK
jgi:hypothetical protein